MRKIENIYSRAKCPEKPQDLQRICRVLEWVAIAFSHYIHYPCSNHILFGNKYGNNSDILSVSSE